VADPEKVELAAELRAARRERAACIQLLVIPLFTRLLCPGARWRHCVSATLHLSPCIARTNMTAKAAKAAKAACRFERDSAMRGGAEHTGGGCARGGAIGGVWYLDHGDCSEVIIRKISS
jgi:hypothetical protein